MDKVLLTMLGGLVALVTTVMLVIFHLIVAAMVSFGLGVGLLFVSWRMDK